MSLRRWFRFWILALALALALPLAWARAEDPPRHSDPESIEQKQSPAEESGILLCSEHLSRGVRENGGKLDSRQLMALRLSDPAMLNPIDWFQSLLGKTIKRALQVRINRSLIAERGLRPGEQYYLIQQLNLKELNEQLLDIGGTQYYLQALDAALNSTLEENPSWGTLIHVNYKDRVVVSSLSPEDFEAKILKNVRDRTQSYIRFLSRESGELVDWDAFLSRSLAVNHGGSIERALFNLRLDLLHISEADWRKEVSILRLALRFLVKTDEDIPELLRQYRRIEKEPDLLDRWAKRTFAATAAPAALANLKRYLQLLAVGDMLPVPAPVGVTKRKIFEKLQKIVDQDPQKALEQSAAIARYLPEAWSLHRSLFLRSSFNARIIISTDLRGLGAHSLRDREAWVAEGGQVSKLSKVYDRTTAFIENQNQDFANALRHIVSDDKSVQSYVSGDDGLWSLPNLSPEKLEELKLLLGRFSNDFYFHVEIVEDAADDFLIRQHVANAVNSAWKALFESKNRLKADEFSRILSELQIENLEDEGGGRGQE